jgi:peptide/nickel transport system substrate-binding protein
MLIRENDGNVPRTVLRWPTAPFAARRRRPVHWAAAAVTSTLVAIALASAAPADSAHPRLASSASSSAAVGDQLRLGELVAASSLDPALGRSYVTILAYDPLVRQTSSGTLVPQLAVSWRYLGKTRRVFEITLRKGVRFSDGSRLTAQVLKASLEHFKEAKGPFVNYATFDSVTVTGPRKVALHLSSPNPLLPTLLNQVNMMGAVVCSAGLRDPSTLATQTCGAGPYVLDRSRTVPGDHYAMKPNPYYWNKKAIRYRSVLVRVIANPNSTLQAMVTGQIDLAEGDGSTVAAARRARLRVSGSPLTFKGITLADRGGELLRPLRDVRVRQALNYAIDRKTIVKALSPTPGVAFPTDQISVPGVVGWVKEYANRYPYNPGRARQLLAAAGYRGGFTVPVASTPLIGLDQMVQAVASYWEKIGVRVQLRSDAQVSEYFTNISNGKFPAFAVVYGMQHLWIDAQGLLLPSAERNPFHTRDAKLLSLLNRAATAPPKQAVALYQHAAKRVADLGWFAPVSMQGVIYYTRSSVAGARATSGRPWIDPRDLHPAGE